MSQQAESTAIEILISDDKALDLIEKCAAEIERAQTLPQIKIVIAKAEAFSLLTKKLQMTERIKRAAFSMVLEAEIQLGRITGALPKHPTGNASNKAKREGQDLPRGKKVTLKDHHIGGERARLAESLAGTSSKKIEKVLQTLPISRLSVTGVASVLGYHQGSNSSDGWQHSREQIEIAKKLAFDAIGLLVTCHSQARSPTLEEIQPFREGFTLHFGNAVPRTKKPRTNSV